jgi:LysM domain
LWGTPAGSGPDVGPSEPTRPEPAITRSADCPFLRLESDGLLVDPEPQPTDDHRCVAINGPRVLSHQQQELVCLRAAHVDCPRYRRRIAPPRPAAHGPIRTPPIPRAIAASLVVLGLSAGISFGFVIQRGGIDLPPSAQPSAAAVVASASPAPATSSPAPSVEPTAEPTQAPTPAPTASPSPAKTPKPTPAPTSAATPAPTPAPLPSGSGGPSASRLAVLQPCPDQTGCYVYTVRNGDNLFSIAHWFGVPLDTIYAWNPSIQPWIRPGDQIKIPTPTR